MDLNWKLTDKDIFHVHSFRCGHAEDVSDEAYIKKAILKSTKEIYKHITNNKTTFQKNYK